MHEAHRDFFDKVIEGGGRIHVGETVLRNLVNFDLTEKCLIVALVTRYVGG